VTRTLIGVGPICMIVCIVSSIAAERPISPA